MIKINEGFVASVGAHVSATEVFAVLRIDWGGHELHLTCEGEKEAIQIDNTEWGEKETK